MKECGTINSISAEEIAETDNDRCIWTTLQVAYGMVKEPVPMGPGPWGGEGGRPWDDGVYTRVKQIYIMRGALIGSIQVEYDRDGYSIWSARHGNSGHITHRVSAIPSFELTCPSIVVPRHDMISAC